MREQRYLRRIERTRELLQASCIVRHLPEFRGTFELDLCNRLSRRILLGGFEPSRVGMFEIGLKPGFHVVDIGANIGLFTVLAAQLVGEEGRVLAAEPVPSMVKLLRSNVARNSLRQVEIFAGAVSAQSGTCSIEFVEGGEEYSSLGSIAHPDVPRQPKRRVDVPGETLDALVASHGLKPAFIKVDTEGAEGLVFTGAQRVLQNDRPIICSELDDRLLTSLKWNARLVVDLLAKCEYRVFDEATGVELAAATMPNPFIGEIIALPSEGCG